MIPSAVAFVLFGDVIIRVFYQRGRFTATDTLFAWGVLAGSAVGLLAGTLGRFYSAAYYSMQDTKRPLRYAIIRVALTMALGWIAAVPLPRYLGIDGHWGTAGLTLTAGIAGWVEFALLRRELQRRIGPATVSRDLVLASGVLRRSREGSGSEYNSFLGSAHAIVVAGRGPRYLRSRVSRDHRPHRYSRGARIHSPIPQSVRKLEQRRFPAGV